MPNDGLRARIVLGKFRVTKIERGTAYIQLGGTTTCAMPIPDFVDLRLGDLLTFYTEAPIKERKQ